MAKLLRIRLGGEGRISAGIPMKITTNIAITSLLAALCHLPACGDSETPSTDDTTTDTDGVGSTGGPTSTSDTLNLTSTTESTTGSDPSTTTSTSGDTGSTTSTTGSSTGTTSTTSGTSSSTSGDTDTSSTDTTGDDCETVWCGTPPECCDVAEECEQDMCLPICASGIRCGPNLDCCQADEVCGQKQTCEKPGDACEDHFDCPPGEYCEPILDQCLEVAEPVECEVIPNFDKVELNNIEWSYAESQVISIPVVADLDGDGVNEVVVSTAWEADNQGVTIELGKIVVLNSRPATKTAEVILTLEESGGTFGSSGRSTIAVGDVDGDGFPDIIYAGKKDARQLGGGTNPDYVGHDSLIHAYSFKKRQYIWESHTGGPDRAHADYNSQKILVHNGALTLANLDDDVGTEIVIGSTIIDNDGEIVWKGDSTHGSPRSYAGGVSAVADLQGDSIPEIISGKDAWKISSWTQGVGSSGSGAAAKVVLIQLWDAAIKNPGAKILDGYPAIADLDVDGDPEIVLVGQGYLSILERDGKLWCGRGSCASDADRTQPYELPGLKKALDAGGSNHGGPPTVADFDKDGRPEIGIADYATYSVYDFNRTISGEAEEVPSKSIPSKAQLQPGDIFTRWRQDTQDVSSSATGSSVFDFQGDGIAEVVYGDECNVRIYSGADGRVLSEIPNTSATIHEYPLVADVDSDGNSEILIVANDIHHQTGFECPEKRHGLFVYGDLKDRWVRTRKLWTQHTYHVTNAGSDGNPPMVEENNWTVDHLNNYRQNVQGVGTFNAPDLVVNVSADLSPCESDHKIRLVATVRNQGSRGVTKGIKVHFFAVEGTMTLIGENVTTVDLLPGQSTKLSVLVDAPPGMILPDFVVLVDGTNLGESEVAECLEDNNSTQISGIFCPAE